MDREQMLKLLDKGRDPIVISIMKWQEGQNLTASDNCALCYKYSTTRCVDCPVRKYTGRPNCLDTPLEALADHRSECKDCRNEDYCDHGKNLIDQEIRLLSEIHKIEKDKVIAQDIANILYGVLEDLVETRARFHPAYKKQQIVRQAIAKLIVRTEVYP